MTKEPRFEVYPDSKGQWRWTFYAANGLKIADSAEGYHNQRDCLHGMMIVKGYAQRAKVNIVQETTTQKIARTLAQRTILGGSVLK